MITIIAVVGNDNAIGRRGDLLWHLSEDLRHFKALTMGHPVIMGRKTWESLPKRPLPKRRNIVVTRNPEYVAEGAEVVASLQEAFDITVNENPFVMGGGEIYNQSLPFADALSLTLVDATDADADTYFPDFRNGEWEEISSEPGNGGEGLPAYRFAEFRRK